MSSKKDLQEEIFWIEALRTGGTARERAILAINKAYQGFIFKAKAQYRLGQEDLVDCYTDALIAVSQHVETGRFKGESRLSTYFFRIFSNRCIDKVRANTTQFQKAKQDWQEAFVHLPDRSQDILTQLIDRDQLQQVKKLMESLGERCKKVLWYSSYWGFSPAEIAEKMGFKSPQSASSQRYQCLQALRKKLNNNSYADRP